jgi:hypothetical protein
LQGRLLRSASSPVCLVLRRREAPSRRTGHGHERCKRPMVRDARLRALLTMRSAVPRAFCLILRSAAAGRASRRMGHGRERCHLPMVRDASLRDAPHHEVSLVLRRREAPSRRTGHGHACQLPMVPPSPSGLRRTSRDARLRALLTMRECVARCARCRGSFLVNNNEFTVRTPGLNPWTENRRALAASATRSGISGSSQQKSRPRAALCVLASVRHVIAPTGALS